MEQPGFPGASAKPLRVLLLCGGEGCFISINLRLDDVVRCQMEFSRVSEWNSQPLINFFSPVLIFITVISPALVNRCFNFQGFSGIGLALIQEYVILDS